LLKWLKTASYVAIDEEMTGISLPGEKPPLKDDTPEQRYQRFKKIPERYSIISVGVSLFHKNPNFKSDVQEQAGATDNGIINVDNNDGDNGITDTLEPEYIAVSGRVSSPSLVLIGFDVLSYSFHSCVFSFWQSDPCRDRTIFTFSHQIRVKHEM
jgi:hypothetical protein